MASFFSAGDLIRVALGIERRGIVFYETMARSTANIAARQVFTELGEMERTHIDVFQNMLDDRDKYEVLESRQPGYDQYLKALVETAIFTDEFITGDLAMAADTDVKAIELGIRAEKDSILFYDQMRETVPKQTVVAVERVLEQEKAHLQTLSNLKKQMLAFEGR